MIKKYTRIDEDKLKKLIFTTNADSIIINLSKGPNCISSFAAYEKEEMVGFIIAWKSSFHPFCTYFDIIFNPHYLGCIEELLAEMEQGEIDYPLQTGVKEGTSLDLYYQENGFERIRKTYLPTINLSTLSIESINPNHVKSLDELSSDSKMVTNLVSLVKRIYEETHLVNPVAEFDLDKWKELIFAEDLILEGSYICLDKNGEEVLAYSFLHEGESDDTVELGWKGSRTKLEMENINLLVGMQIEYAKRIGYQLLEGEFDTTDPYAMKVLHTFLFPKSPVWITYQKK